MNIKEYDDRFETEIIVDQYVLNISKDKPAEVDVISALFEEFSENAKSLLINSKDYFKNAKSRYKVEYIDDLTDPQIIIGDDDFCIFWYSENGDLQGEGIIGIDYNRETNQPFQLIIGD